jgi:hypothetical protein
MTPKLGGFDGPTAEEENEMLLDELQKRVPAEHHEMLNWLKGACECYCLCDAGSAAMTCHPCAARKMLLSALIGPVLSPAEVMLKWLEAMRDSGSWDLPTLKRAIEIASNIALNAKATGGQP